MKFNNFLNKKENTVNTEITIWAKIVISTKLKQSSNLAIGTGFIIISAGLS
jgi:hypothetical protein